MLERKEYGTYKFDMEDIFDDAIDACDEVVNYLDSYLTDAIMEVADSYVPTYDNDLFNNCKELAPYVEEAMYNGNGADGLVELLRAGAYEYYTQLLYNNIENIIFNIAYDYIIDEYEEYDDKLSDYELEEALSAIDSDNRISDIIEAVDELIDDLKEALDLEENEE